VSERGEIKKIGAKAHKNSGRGQYQKGDASLANFVIDIKEASKSFNLNQDVWAKITTDCLKTDREKDPALMVVLGDKTKVRLAVIEWEVLEEILENYAGRNR
jgi:hypothetical protein